VRRADLRKARLEDTVWHGQPVRAVRDHADPARAPPVAGGEGDVVGCAPPDLDGEVDALPVGVGGLLRDVVAQRAQAVGRRSGVQRPLGRVLRELWLATLQGWCCSSVDSPNSQS
jgi:hypothetical protein